MADEIDMNLEDVQPADEQTPDEEQEEEEQPTTECTACPTCTTDAILMAMGAQASACASVEDQDAKARCMEDAAGMDVAEIENAKEVYKKILQGPAGMKGLTKASIAFNIGVREAIIEDVQEKLDKGEKVDDQEFAAYQNLLLGRQG
jgi:hypothetical protein